MLVSVNECTLSFMLPLHSTHHFILEMSAQNISTCRLNGENAAES